MFPFRWHIESQQKERFGEQIAFRNINIPKSFDNWKRITEQELPEEKEILYNEKNYFYEFVHNALYDTGDNDNKNIVRHFERNEPKYQEVHYIININDKKYKLNVDAINLNLYSTGVGVLSFYLYNELYSDKTDILIINQYGRRVYPPFYTDKMIHQELATEIGFEGLNGIYREDFQTYGTSDHNQPSRFIQKMIHEVAPNIDITAIIDDRMYTMSWYKNDSLINQLCENNTYANNDWWYQFVFVDGESLTCQDDLMKKDLIDKATYTRWKKYHTLYGMSRYSFLMLTNAGENEKFLYDYFQTQYARMVELILVQKASVLRFSAEVTNISSMDNEKLDDQLREKVRSLYKEYIRFVNQIHFREISAQDQAIELYDMLYETARLKDHVEKLDNEIEELFNYVSLQENNKTNDTMSKLTKIATFFVPATFVAGLFGMNNHILSEESPFIFFNGWFQILMVGLAMIFLYPIFNKNKEKKS